MLKNKILTWLNLLLMGVYTIPVAYSIWFVGLFNRFTKLKYYIAQSWTIPWMWAARSKVTLIKNYDYKKNQPYVVISNHLSNLDPMMQFRYLKIKWVFMAKKEVYKLPFFRTAAKSFNFIKVDRSDKNDRKSINAHGQKHSSIMGGHSWYILREPEPKKILFYHLKVVLFI